MSVNPLGSESRRAEVESPPGVERPEEGVSPVLITDLASKTLAVKEGDAFLYSDLEGNLEQEADYGLGLYSKDTRFLSRFRLTINGRAPVLLSSSSERGYMSHVDLTNPDLYDDQVLAVPQQTLNIRRIRAISGRLFERVRMKNYNPFPVTIEVEFAFGADFADIFEVRGMTREGSRPSAAPKVEDGRIDFVYEGRDGVRRITRIEFGARADRIDVVDFEATATFRVHLGPYQTKLIGLSVDPIIEDGRPSSVDFDHAVHELRRSYEEWERDSLIASHQLLMVNTRPARDALELLAAKQGTIEDDWRDEEPGKILHEIRQGELARAGLIPHSPYYGSVDATPWFVLLYAQHFRWTGDLAFAEKLLPAAQAALAWIDDYGDLDGDGCRLEDEAAALRARFNEAFWMGDEKYFAQALDADKRQVRTITSNPGHALYCGIVDDEKAVPLAKRLLSPDMFSGWGIRTMSKAAAAYNPMSYHNGSVWPHDNALIAAGLKRYGMARSTNRVATALFDAAVNAAYMRLPEPFCGFTRRTPNRPVSYPVACSPQAWAAGSPFLMLQAMLGISARAHQNLLTVNLPHLPTWLNTVEVRNLAVGDSRISVVFRREGEITSFSLLSREGDVRVVMEE